MAETGRDKKTGRFQPGHSITRKHGAWAAKTVPDMKGARALRKYLTAFQVELEAAVENRTVKADVLIGQVVRSERQLRLIELWLSKYGIVLSEPLKRGKVELQPCVTNTYIQLLSAQRMALVAMGIKSKKELKPRILPPWEEETDEDNN